MSRIYSNPEPLEYVTKDASLIRELLNGRVRPGLGLSLAEAVLEAGQSTAAHRHTAFDEIYYGLEGRGRLFVEGQSFAFGPSSCYLLPRGAAHHLEAKSRLRLLCICCPGYTHEETILL